MGVCRVWRGGAGLSMWSSGKLERRRLQAGGTSQEGEKPTPAENVVWTDGGGPDARRFMWINLRAWSGGLKRYAGEGAWFRARKLTYAATENCPGIRDDFRRVIPGGTAS